MTLLCEPPADEVISYLRGLDPARAEYEEGTVYLLHLLRPYIAQSGKGVQQFQHYIGHAEPYRLIERLSQHGTASGARCLYVARQDRVGPGPHLARRLRARAPHQGFRRRPAHLPALRRAPPRREPADLRSYRREDPVTATQDELTVTRATVRRGGRVIAYLAYSGRAITIRMAFLELPGKSVVRSTALGRLLPVGYTEGKPDDGSGLYDVWTARHPSVWTPSDRRLKSGLGLTAAVRFLFPEES
jgi:hypothetical protein